MSDGLSMFPRLYPRGYAARISLLSPISRRSPGGMARTRCQTRSTSVVTDTHQTIGSCHQQRTIERRFVRVTRHTFLSRRRSVPLANVHYSASIESRRATSLVESRGIELAPEDRRRRGWSSWSTVERSCTECSGGCGDNRVIAPPSAIRADTTLPGRGNADSVHGEGRLAGYHRTALPSRCPTEEDVCPVVSTSRSSRGGRFARKHRSINETVKKCGGERRVLAIVDQRKRR
ncbi:unnamed protein product [Xylocopa violacea]|uniref:Uncharacterized protein n=1 Tax=Xylocopa violacea TaxID=135666 RepID=A0ABP1N3X5_XYLVO